MGPYKEKLGNLQKSGATSPVNEYLDMALADCTPWCNAHWWVIWKIANWRIENGLLWPAAIMSWAFFLSDVCCNPLYFLQMGCGCPIPGKVAAAAFSWENMGAVAWQFRLPWGEEGGQSPSSSPAQHQGCDDSLKHNRTARKSGSFIQFVVIWIWLIKTSESCFTLPT